MTLSDSISALVSTAQGRRVIEVAVVVTGIFVAIDAGVIHPRIWENQPTLFYFTIKPIIVGPTILAVSWWLVHHQGVSQWAAVAVAGLVGILYLQLYYTVFPIPIVEGDPIQIGLVGNLTEGVIVHYGGLAAAIVFVIVAYRLRGYRFDGE